jgi:hypothetical protein
LVAAYVLAQPAPVPVPRPRERVIPDNILYFPRPDPTPKPMVPAPVPVPAPAPVTVTPKPTPAETHIFRMGNHNYFQLTPRPQDASGLSFQFTRPPFGSKYMETTLEAVNATGVLTAVPDGGDHVSVRPRNITELSEWIATRPNANESPIPIACCCTRLRGKEFSCMQDSNKHDLSALSWDRSPVLQLEAIHGIVADEMLDPSLLLQDNIPKSCWKNAALILAQWGSPRIDGVVPDLFRWLQDMNWPGALEVLVLLYDLPEEITKGPLQDAIAKARETSDDEWMDNLTYFANRNEWEQKFRDWLEKNRGITADYFSKVFP